MNQSENRWTMMEKLAGSLMLLSFGLAMLAYLIAIDRPEWFNLRPASGTAAAMAKAPQYHPSDDEKAKVARRIVQLRQNAGQEQAERVN